MENTVYVVMGVTGEFDERVQWPVAVFVDKKAAEERVRLATKWLSVNFDRNVDGSNLWQWQRANTNPYDPKMKLTTADTGWYVEEVPLFS